MKKEIKPIQKDYSFLQAMSTEELQEILRRDMDLNQDESDIDLVLKALEVLESREKDSESENEEEDALNQLRETIKHREAMFADAAPLTESDSLHTKSDHKKHLWLRIASIAAVFVLVVTIGFTAANAMGHDLWGGVVKWTKDTFRFGEKTIAFSPNETLDELKTVLEEDGITFPVLPNWLPDQYSFEDIQVFKEPAGCRITAFATSNEKMLFLHLTDIKGTDPGDRKYEINGDSVEQYVVNGTTYYSMTNDDSKQIIWAKDNYQILLEFSDSSVNTKKIIDSIK